MITRLCIQSIRDALFRSWSIGTSSKWIRDNPANGQCSVTALVVHDLVGGEILKTHLSAGWHFYNKIEGIRCDFTESQFREKSVYTDLPSSREEAFQDTSMQQYELLKTNLLKNLDRKPL